MKHIRRQPQTPSAPPRLSRWFALPMADSPRIEPRLRAILAPSRWRIARSSRRERAGALIASAALALTLGTVHPVAERRNAVASGIAFASDSSLLLHKESSVDKVPRFLIDRISSNPHWTRVLPNNTGTVELVGISLRHDEKNDLTGKPDPITGVPMDESSAKRVLSRSWMPDGLSYSQPLYSVGIHFTHYAVPPKRLLEFSLRYRSRDDIALQVSGDEFSCSSFPDTHDGMPVDGFQKGDKIWQGDIVLPRSQKTFPARFRVAAGPYRWHEDKTILPNADNSSSSDTVGIGKDVTRLSFVGPFFDRKGQCGFTVTYSGLKSYDTNIVAFDHQHREVKLSEQISKGGEGYTQVNLTFDKTTPVDQLATLRFEARPYQTVDFGNVALYPTKESR